MEEIKELAGNVMENILENNSGVSVNQGDYIGKDGLIYCGKCNGKKQRFVILPDGLTGGEKNIRKVGCMCQCDIDQYEIRKQNEEYRDRMARIRRIRDSSMMDSGYQKAEFASYMVTKQNQKAYQVAKKYADGFKTMQKENQGIIFWGPVGTGKSFTAACIANELLNREIPVVMTSFVKILQNIRQQNEAEYIAMLNSAALLILDDLGAERNTDYAFEKVYNIVDSRYRASKPMILTTNLTIREMMENEDIRYKRIYDRIFETCLPVEVPGNSFRKMVAEQRFDRMAKFIQEG